MSRQGLTDDPPVSKSYRPVVRQLRQHGLLFDARGSGGAIRICQPDGTYTGLAIPRAGRSAERMGPKDKATLRELEARGWYNPGGSKAAKHTGGSTGGGTHLHVAPQPRSEGALAVAAEAEVAKVVRLPVRARTGHQYRADAVRTRLLRVLYELGGNNRSNRGEFVKHALAEAAQHNLRMPQPEQAKRSSGKDAIYVSALNSLGRFLKGHGQAGWMLDVWDLACATLENPTAVAHLDSSTQQLLSSTPGRPQRQRQAGGSATPAAPAATPVPETPVATPPGTPQAVATATAGRGYARTGREAVGQHSDEDGVLREVVLPVGDSADVERKAAELDAALAAAPSLVDAERRLYLQQLREQALAGDGWAAARLEALLGLA